MVCVLFWYVHIQNQEVMDRYFESKEGVLKDFLIDNPRILLAFCTKQALAKQALKHDFVIEELTKRFGENTVQLQEQAQEEVDELADEIETLKVRIETVKMEGKQETATCVLKALEKQREKFRAEMEAAKATSNENIEKHVEEAKEQLHEEVKGLLKVKDIEIKVQQERMNELQHEVVKLEHNVEEVKVIMQEEVKTISDELSKQSQEHQGKLKMLLTKHKEELATVSHDAKKELQRVLKEKEAEDAGKSVVSELAVADSSDTNTVKKSSRVPTKINHPWKRSLKGKISTKSSKESPWSMKVLQVLIYDVYVMKIQADETAKNSGREVPDICSFVVTYFFMRYSSKKAVTAKLRQLIRAISEYSSSSQFVNSFKRFCDCAEFLPNNKSCSDSDSATSNSAIDGPVLQQLL
jgi:hypothetical protein